MKKAAEQVGRKPADLGWVALGAGRPAGLSATSFDAIARALVPLEPGESSEVIETPDGFFIARLDEEKHARSPEAGFLKERAEIEPSTLARKQKQMYEAWMAALRAKAKIRISLDAG